MNVAKAGLITKRTVNPFKELWRNKFLYILALPAVAYTFIYGYMTLPYMVIAFEKYKFSDGLLSEWIGLSHFVNFFKSPWALTVTRNTVALNMLFIIVGTVFSVLLAVLLSEVAAKKLAKTMQSMMLFPFFISWVIVNFMLQGIIGTDTGMLNRWLVSMGYERIGFYQQPQYWYFILVLLNIWKGAGYSSIIYLSAITGIDEELYEAAYIDGATRFQRVIRITLPLLMPTVSIMTLMAIGRIFYGDFGMFYAIIGDNGSLMKSCEVIDTYVYRLFKMTGDPSKSTAIGFYQSIVGFVLVFGSNMVVKFAYPEGRLF